MWRQHLVGKLVRIDLKDGHREQTVYGEVVSINEGYLVERDTKGRIHFLSMSLVLRISEVAEQERPRTEKPQT